MKKRRLAVSVLTASMVMGLFGCGNPAETEKAAPAETAAATAAPGGTGDNETVHFENELVGR